LNCPADFIGMIRFVLHCKHCNLSFKVDIDSSFLVLCFFDAGHGTSVQILTCISRFESISTLLFLQNNLDCVLLFLPTGVK